jgi:hypothetical protein
MDTDQEKAAGTTISTSYICPGGEGRLYVSPIPMYNRCDSTVWCGNTRFNKRIQVFWLLGPYAVFTLAFGGIIVPKLNL